METHIFRLPIIYKILMLFFSAFFVYSLVIINDLYWLFVLAAASFLGGFYFLNVTYIFESNNLKIKLPFLKAKTYNLQNLIGYSFDSMSGETKLHLFFQDNKKAVLEFSGKKLKNYLILFLKEKHSFIEEKNIQELIENGLQFKLNKKQEIIFKKFYIELTENGIPAKKYSYDSAIKEMEIRQYGTSQFLKIDLNDNRTIRFNSFQLKGGIGLFSYLLENVQC